MKYIKLQYAVLSIIGIFLIFSLSSCDINKKSAVVGSPAPDIEIADAVSGKKISTAEFKGKIIFINFWASWCEPCRGEIPSIDRLFRHYMKNDKFLMLTILYRDDPQNAINYLRYAGYNFPVMVDDYGKAARHFGLTGVPETFIIDKKGILREKIIGPYEWDSVETVSLITKLLGE